MDGKPWETPLHWIPINAPSSNKTITCDPSRGCFVSVDSRRSPIRRVAGIMMNSSKTPHRFIMIPSTGHHHHHQKDDFKLGGRT
ncbi:hypothetical protein CEXT_53431 [Caerostris extrusa]|uniref:Uncharacterized protein n=1 Tax=Caerostris extrusa TaxID=172846 RepID=A0AAV4UQN6_CAEEX|nr:hypothetical protein CEXT_53431 [Caerostris extrusa]